MKKMRNKAIRYTSIAMSAVMLAGTVVSTVSADEAKEEVELTVFGNQYQPSEVGTQSVEKRPLHICVKNRWIF